MKYWKKFREFDKKGLLLRESGETYSVTHTGYVLDKRVFRTAMILIGVGICAVLISALQQGVGWEEVYFYCPSNFDGGGTNYFGTNCQNPFYLNCEYEACRDYVLMETVPPGTLMGKPPSEEYEEGVSALVRFIAGVLMLAFIANHFLHNGGKDPTMMYFDWRKIEVE